MGRGQVKGPFGSHDRPASALYMRLGLAIFGTAVLVVGAVLAALLTDSLALVVLLAGGSVIAAINVYWVSQRIRYER